MAEGKREYIAIFSVGARLLGSFKGAMSAAQARLRALGAVAKTVVTTLGEIAMGFVTMGAALAGAAVGTILAKIFKDAISNAEQLADHQRKMTAFLRSDMGMRKRGNEFIENQLRLLDQHNEKLAEASVYNSDIYNSAMDTLITYGAMPHHLAQMAGPLGDTLAALKGPRATMGDMAVLTDHIGRAIEGGPTLQLERLGISVNKTAVQWHKMSKEARFETLLKAMKQYEGEAKRQMDTPIGKMVMFQRAIDDLSQSVGNVLLPVLGDVADAMRRILIEPGIKPAIEGTLRGIGKAAVWATEQLGDFLKAITPEIDSSAFPDLHTQIEQIIPSMRQLNVVTGQVDQGFDATSSSLNDYTRGIGNIAAPTLLSSFQELGNAISEIAGHIKGVSAAQEEQKPVAQSWGAWLGQQADDVALHFAAMNKSTVQDLKGLETAWVAINKVGNQVFDSGWVKTAWSATLDWLGKAFGTLWEGAANAARDAFDKIKGYWDALTSWITNFKLSSLIPSFVPYGGAGNKAPAPTPAPAATTPVGGAAFGGIFRRHSITQIAENGPEAVIPLSGGRRAEGLLSYANRAIGTPAAGPTHVNFAPVVTINGNATENEQRAMDSKLRGLASDFIDQFKAAQYQERRLSYESGYG